MAHSPPSPIYNFIYKKKDRDLLFGPGRYLDSVPPSTGAGVDGVADHLLPESRSGSWSSPGAGVDAVGEA